MSINLFEVSLNLESSAFAKHFQAFEGKVIEYYSLN